MRILPGASAQHEQGQHQPGKADRAAAPVYDERDEICRERSVRQPVEYLEQGELKLFRFQIHTHYYLSRHRPGHEPLWPSGRGLLR